MRRRPSALAISRRLATYNWRGPRNIADLAMRSIGQERLRRGAGGLHLRLGVRRATVGIRGAWGEVARAEVPYEELAVVPCSSHQN